MFKNLIHNFKIMGRKSKKEESNIEEVDLDNLEFDDADLEELK
jgi:hypothetical protein